MIEIDAFHSATLAILLLAVGKIVMLNAPLLRVYSIPEAVIGGVICAAAVALIHVFLGSTIQFDLEVRNFLLLLFFSGIGLKSDVRSLVQGGRPLLVLVLVASALIVAQNVLGLLVAAGFGLPPLAGLMTGSISLTGGLGTTLAWTPRFVDDLGIPNALELGVASNTIGLITACIIGGPIATYLMRRHKITPSGDTNLDIGARYDEPEPKLDYSSVLWAIFILNVTIMIGTALDAVIALTGMTLPTFVSCLIAGILLRNLMPYGVSRSMGRIWPSLRQSLALVSDIALGLFLVMALMGLKLWELNGAFGFVSTALALQTVLSVAFAAFVVFPLMGRDYQATVISAGFGGIALGSTATAVANMTAVTQQYGAAHRAFIIVPLVCGFFIDIINALVISSFIGIWS